MRFLLTGYPGVGKTTICRKVSEELRGEVTGFYTEEVRVNGTRIGFDIVTLGDNEQRGILARTVSQFNGPKVGQYTVHVTDFESIAIPCLKAVGRQYLVVDEIGKMESFSQKFKQEIRRLFAEFDGDIIATIPHSRGSPLPLVQEISELSNTEIIMVTKENRDSIHTQIINRIKNIS